MHARDLACAEIRMYPSRKQHLQNETGKPTLNDIDLQ